MENYFDRKFLMLENELRYLKTCAVRSSVNVPMVHKTVDVSVPLELKYSNTEAEGSVFYKITMDGDYLVLPSLDWYYGDISKAYQYPYTTRHITQTLYRLDDDSLIIEVYARGTMGSSGDVQTLINGGSVNVTGKLTVACSGNFNIEVYNG